MPTNVWGLNILKSRMLDAPLVRVHGMIGFQGYFSGPKVIIIDPVALSEPLLARMPAIAHEMRIGHLIRYIPDGYVDTILSGENHLEDKNLALFYDKLCLITRGPFFTRQRWETILKMNTGRYDHLIDKDYYRAQAPNANHPL